MATQSTTSNVRKITYVNPEAGGDGQPEMKLRVEYERTRNTGGEPAAKIVNVDDLLRGYTGVEGRLSDQERAAIEAEIDLPIREGDSETDGLDDAADSGTEPHDGEAEKQPLEWETSPRWWRTSEGEYRRVAYLHHGRRDWIGGVGYVFSDVVSVWNPEHGRTHEEVAQSASPGEQFKLIVTPEKFASKTFPPEDLPPIGREVAREALIARPGDKVTCRFIKRTTGELRVMRFRYHPERDGRGSYGYDPETKGLLPVHDLDKDAPRMINLSGVRTIDGVRTVS